MVYRIDTPDSIVARNAAPSPGPEGWFQTRNFVAGIEATVLPAWWADMVQGELCAPIDWAGIAHDKTNPTQSVLAIQRIAARIASGAFAYVNGNATLGIAQLGTVMVDAGSASRVINLPPAGLFGGLDSNTMTPEIRLIRVDANTANAVSINPVGNDSFRPGSATITDLQVGEMLLLRSDGGTGWIAYRQGARYRYIFGNAGPFQFTPRVGVWLHEATILGAGAGGGAAGSSGNGSGGGAGGSARDLLRLSPSGMASGIVGLHGMGGTNANAAAGAGGATSFGPLSATGGSPGVGGNLAPNNAGGAPGIGGSTTGTALCLPGGYGGDGSTDLHTATGYGGSSLLGFGGRAQSGSATGIAGTGPGAGGGGAYGNNGVGGNGTDGVVMLQEAQ